MTVRSFVTHMPLISRSTFASSSRSTTPRLASLTSTAARFPMPISASSRTPDRALGIRPHPSRYASTYTAAPSPPLDMPPVPPNPRLSVTPPSLAAIQKDGYLDDDVQLLPEAEASLRLTSAAVQQLVSISSREPPGTLAKGKLALRVGVESGGWMISELFDTQYRVGELMAWSVMQPEGVECIPVVVDLISLGLLKGATLHHATELIGSSFRLQDNPQAKEGGSCGCGVSWEAKS